MRRDLPKVVFVPAQVAPHSDAPTEPLISNAPYC